MYVQGETTVIKADGVKDFLALRLVYCLMQEKASSARRRQAGNGSLPSSVSLAEVEVEGLLDSRD